MLPRVERMRNRLILISGIVLTLIGLFLGLLNLLDFAQTTTERCPLTGRVFEKDGQRMVQVRKSDGTCRDALLFKDDRRAYQAGDSVLVSFPMGPSNVLVGYPKVMHYILDYYILLAAGVVLLIAGILKRPKSLP